MRSSLVLGILLLLWQATALAQNPDPKEAVKYADAGFQLYTKKKYKDAIEAYKKAITFLPPDDEKSADLHLEIGRCYRELKKPEEVIHHTTEFLRIKPQANQRAALLEFIAKERSALPKQNRALLTLDSAPQEAAVYAIDAKGGAIGIGLTPIVEHPLPEGTISLRLVHRSFPVVEEKLDPSQAKPQLTIELDPAKRPTAPTSTKTDETTGKKGGAKLAVPIALFVVGAGSAGGSLFFANQFNQDLALFDQTPVGDPEIDVILARLTKEAYLADGLAVAAVGASVAGALLLRKGLRASKEEPKASLVVTPSGLAAVGSF